jgi:hypothetical protein
MKPFAARFAAVTVTVIPLLSICAFLAVSNHGGRLSVIDLSVVSLSLLLEFLFSRCIGGFWLCLTGAFAKGAVVGLSAWVIVMFLVSIMSDPGDKFGLYVVFFSLVPAGLGGLAGGIACFANYLKRNERKAARPAPIETCEPADQAYALVGMARNVDLR